MKVTINGEAIACNPAEANTFDEVFNTANAAVCVDQSTVDAYMDEMNQVWPVFEDYSVVDHGLATMYMIGQATSWTLGKTVDMMSTLF